MAASYLQAAMLCSIYYINTNEIPNHFKLIVFWFIISYLRAAM